MTGIRFECPTVLEIGPARTVISADCHQRSAGSLGENEPALGTRNWWTLRDVFLRIKNKQDAAKFFASAGYVFVEDGLYSHAWAADHIHDELWTWVRNYQCVLDEMMTTSNLGGWQRKLRDYLANENIRIGTIIQEAYTFSGSTHSPHKHTGIGGIFPRLSEGGHLNPAILEECLLGFGGAQALQATFTLGKNGTPLVAVRARNPLQAIVATVHIDRTRKRKSWVHCGHCDTRFLKKKSNQRFCEGGQCSNRERQLRFRKSRATSAKRPTKSA